MDILWEKASKIIKEKVSQQNYETWIRPIRIIAMDREKVGLAVPNRFFGGNVSVAGLLTAADIRSALSTHGPRPEDVVVPDIVLNADGLTLDGVSWRELQSEGPGTLRLVSSDARGLLEALQL